jgi:hypothetical protein
MRNKVSRRNGMIYRSEDRTGENNKSSKHSKRDTNRGRKKESNIYNVRNELRANTK